MPGEITDPLTEEELVGGRRGTATVTEADPEAPEVKGRTLRVSGA